ncbi:MAG TPA: hypothetical protein VKX49_23410 [Bryobacteraceae bacterium]|nr:hypothetical protein [Bryobacteraceae bacterium]
MTAKDLWLYRDERYIEAHERLLRESNALWDLLDEMGWKPSTTDEHESVRAVRELRERLMAAHNAEPLAGR